MQGTKQAVRAFYKLIKNLLAKKGVHPTSINPDFFVFVYKTEWLVFVCCETDNFLLATNCTAAYTMIRNTIKEAFGVTIQSGQRLSYLNFCILQSQFGISTDQTDHILQMLQNFFSDGKPDREV